jgi:hypothetical protein
MPAPSLTVIKTNLVNALKANGFTKKTFDSSGKLQDSGELTDDAAKLVEALALGISVTWNDWQIAQGTFAEVSGATATGTGPTALP